jgi:hypothetical protein
MRGFGKEYEDPQDYGFLLSFINKSNARRVLHISKKVLSK